MATVTCNLGSIKKKSTVTQHCLLFTVQINISIFEAREKYTVQLSLYTTERLMYKTVRSSGELLFVDYMRILLLGCGIDYRSLKKNEKTLRGSLH